jgi:transcriptional antiterminator RfaH
MNLDSSNNLSVKSKGSETDLSWYAAQLRPNGDSLAAVNLQRQGFNSFRPQIWETKRTEKGTQRLLKPMFPGYVFIEFDVSEPNWAKIRSTHGISRVVGNIDGRPSRLPTGLVELLKQRCATNLVDPFSHAFRAGDEVHVSEGPLSAFLATVERVDAQKRVWLLIDFMGRATRFSSDADKLVPRNLCI